MTPAALVAAVREHGYAVEMTGDGPRLVPLAKGSPPLPPRLLADLKRHRDKIVAHLTACAACGRDVTDAENRALLRCLNPHCERPKCPYRTE